MVAEKIPSKPYRRPVFEVLFSCLRSPDVEILSSKLSSSRDPALGCPKSSACRSRARDHQAGGLARDLQPGPRLGFSFFHPLFPAHVPGSYFHGRAAQATGSTRRDDPRRHLRGALVFGNAVLEKLSSSRVDLLRELALPQTGREAGCRGMTGPRTRSPESVPAVIEFMP